MLTFSNLELLEQGQGEVNQDRDLLNKTQHNSAAAPDGNDKCSNEFESGKNYLEVVNMADVQAMIS